MNKCFALIAMMAFFGGCVTTKIEEPKYDVVARHGDLEIRSYAPRILAETIVEGDFEDAPNEGFRRLAKFIFGDNTPGSKVAMTAPVGVTPKDSGAKPAKIEMTAPVTQQASSAGAWAITFTMPASYTMETLPKPVDGRVTLRQLAPVKYAALRFGGFNTRSNVDEAIGKLREMASKQGLTLRGEPVYARYNPPWTPWFWRRNEILIEVAN